MQNNPNTPSNKGLFISFEGGEGAGKSTQINLLKSYLLKNKINVKCTREPGGTEEGEFIRKFLVSGDQSSWDPYSELLLFNALRREHIKKVITPALQNGGIVLCDRFVDSTIIYQGVVGLINEEIIINLHKTFCYNLFPDITFFLSLNPKLGLSRTKLRNNNENRFEKMGLSYHQKIQNSFKALSKKYHKRFIEINADQTIEQISEDINQHFNFIINKND
ncbi:dTMP kinase [Alphaproteobacteria bacterium]|nr:dTMP kinase [Alphaproteobacteria bacterium]MDC1023345.1 dTMP kinase [Alphaproteobacteria bacterium]